MMRLPKLQDFWVPAITASIVMLGINREETIDVLMDVMVAKVTFLVFVVKRYVVWTVKEHFVVETVLLSIRQ